MLFMSHFALVAVPAGKVSRDNRLSSAGRILPSFGRNPVASGPWSNQSNDRAIRAGRFCCLHSAKFRIICRPRSLLDKGRLCARRFAVRIPLAVQGLHFMRKIILAAAVAGAALTLAACSKPAEEAAPAADESAMATEAAPAADAAAPAADAAAPAADAAAPAADAAAPAADAAAPAEAAN
jgi:hypothetical protein